MEFYTDGRDMHGGLAREVEYLLELGASEEKAFKAATRYPAIGKISPRIEFCIQI